MAANDEMAHEVVQAGINAWICVYSMCIVVAVNSCIKSEKKQNKLNQENHLNLDYFQTNHSLSVRTNSALPLDFIVLIIKMVANEPYWLSRIGIIYLTLPPVFQASI